MATTSQPTRFRDEITECNHRLDSVLRTRVGITVRTYKVIKALTQLVGSSAVVYGMTLGADPGFAILLLTVIISGPEAFEAILTEGGDDS